ncbi:MAG TPA: hypothetical protein VHE83_02095 [Mycobacteriales bacterium]|nr:hypothetical protein [Mycobacteriales bacterium]
MSERVRSAATAAVVVFYLVTVALAAVLLVVVGDHTLAIALVALELSIFTGAHLVVRHGRAEMARTGPPDPAIPVLDRPGHEPATTQGTWRVVGAMLGGIGGIAVLIIVINALGH